MSGLAEQELNQSPARVWAGRVALIGGIAAVLGLGVWLLSGMSAKPSAPKRQTVAIKVLPDTPPPPPKPEDKPPPPKEEPKQVMQMDAPKVQAPQEAPAQLKMEGAAGDGPSAFAAGSVSKDYVGGPIGNGAGTGTQSNRAQFQFFFNSAKQQLKDEIERHLRSDASELTAVFSIWLDSDGAIRRVAVEPSGHAEADAQVRAALDEVARNLRLPPPPDLPQPLKFRLSLRPQG